MTRLTQKRQLAGHDVGAIGLGCMSFGGMYGATNEADSINCLTKAVEFGIDHLDVAEVYGGGLCESVIGKFLRQTNADVKIATKAGIYSTPTRSFKNDEASLRASLEGSLRRLGRDHVELFYIHRREQTRPIEEVMLTLSKFIDEGLIGAIGLSEVAPSTLRRACAVHPVAAVQSEYSLWTRLPELGMIQACGELGVTFVAFSPVGRGIFADTFPNPATFSNTDFRKQNPRFIEPNYSANTAVIAQFQQFCRARGWSTAATANAWTLAQGNHILPIPGTRTAQNLADCAQADQIIFTDADLAEIERLLPVGFAHGNRYSEAQIVGVEQYC
jgi:aryl-alcohol dehydrogenase-like predicted oxidoreductase